MAYNNFNNYPYGMPYGYGYNSYQQPQVQPQIQPQQQVNYQQAPQTTYLPLTFTSGIVGAKSFIVPPNQTVYLLDSDEGSNLMFQKSADPYGKYTIKAFRVNEINLEDVGKPISSKVESSGLTKSDLNGFATKNDLNDFRAHFESKMNEISNLIQKNARAPKNSANSKDSD